MFKKFKSIIDNLEGDIAEVGVYQGKSARKLAETFPDKAIHLFDTFSGMPPHDPSIDSHKEGDFASTSLSLVQEYLRDFKNIRYYPGIFPLSGKLLPPYPFVFINIDVDLYRSTKDCLTFFWPLLVKNGILFIQDDYGTRMTRGVTAAVDEFIYREGRMLEKEDPSAWIIK